MFVPLREMLKADVFKGSKLITGHSAEGEREKTVTSINVIDGAMGYHYAEKNMLVLCSGYAIAKKTEQQIEFIEQLAKRGVVAVALKPQNFKMGVIPEALRTRAEQLDLAVIALPNESVSYADFFSFFAANIFCRGISDFLGKDTLLKKMIENMSSKGLAWLVEYLHGLSNNNVSVLFNDVHYIDLDTDPISDVAMSLSKHSSAKNVVPSQIFPGMFVLTRKKREDPCTHTLGTSLNFDLNTIGEIWFYRTDAEMNANDAAMLDCAKLACELEINQLLIYHQQQARTRHRFLKHLLTGQLRTLHESMLYAKALNWRLPLELRVLVISCQGTPAILQEMELAVNSVFEKQHIRIIVYPYNERLVVFLPTDEPQLDFCSTILTELQHRFPGHRFLCGLGREVKLQNIRLGYEQAVYSLEIGSCAFPENTVHEFEKLGLFRLYCPFALPQEIVAFCNDYLGPLTKFDAENKLDLLKTLKAYFDCGENFSRTGNELFLHSNTIRYRVEIISKICNIDFANPDDTLNVRTALRLLPLIPSLSRFESKNPAECEDT